MTLNSQIEHLQRNLNSHALLPDKALRRNSAVYELVCYVNNVIAMNISGNHGPIKIFIERAEIFMSENEAAHPIYYQNVEEYFSLLKRVINS